MAEPMVGDVVPAAAQPLLEQPRAEADALALEEPVSPAPNSTRTSR
jgi:hypothetical protein